MQIVFTHSPAGFGPCAGEHDDAPQGCFSDLAGTCCHEEAVRFLNACDGGREEAFRPAPASLAEARRIGRCGGCRSAPAASDRRHWGASFQLLLALPALFLETFLLNLTGQPRQQRYCTPEEYFAPEAVSKERHEYFGGKVFAMASGTK